MTTIKMNYIPKIYTNKFQNGECILIDKLTKLLIKAGVIWFPKKIAKYLFANGAVVVTRCEDCDHCKEVLAPFGTVWYCRMYEHNVPNCGYCHSSKERIER